MGSRSETTNPRRYGWTTVAGPDGVRVNVRFNRDAEGRWVVTGMFIEGEAIASDTLRKIPLGRLEALANTDLASLALTLEQAGAPPSDGGLTLDDLRSLASAAPVPTVRRPPLRRPDGTDPDAFYREVATAYASAAAESSRPAAVLAEEASVPVTTVHRWVREARRRGLLPPGKKGKAG
ncbi:hypothetical protein [Streptosporangium sp. NPDC020145]|uniref:hypothetical protein n=1 Tax=Streptosporangium sp. NPDC020145 TaxID=3154694 RepID=UPI00344229BD